MKKFKLERREIQFALAIALLGFVFSMREWILFLDGQSPFMGFLIYYGIIYVSLLILSKVGFVLMGHHVKEWHQALGVMLIMIAFFTVFNWESQYVNIVAHGSLDNISPIYFQSEDGMTWAFWEGLGFANTEILRLLTFVISPFIEALCGGMLLMHKPKFSLNGG